MDKHQEERLLAAGVSHGCIGAMKAISRRSGEEQAIIGFWMESGESVESVLAMMEKNGLGVWDK